MKKLMFSVGFATVSALSMGAGFGIYEASSRGNAMGGAIVGDSFNTDATMNYYNPANISFAEKVQLAAGVTFINPYCDVDVEHKSQDRMNPGWFTVPTFYATIPLPLDFTFGFGTYTEYGLGTKYAYNWALAGDTKKTTMRQVTLNPNLAYKVTSKWSVAAGLRFSWIQFQNRKSPYAGETRYQDYSVGPYSGTLSATDAYHLSSKLKGDDWGMGWIAATSYQLNEDISFGLVYRSQVKHKIKGRFTMDGTVSGQMNGVLSAQGLPLPDQAVSSSFSQSQYEHKRASAKLRLPRSITGGVNWNVTPKYRVGASLTWTEWSSIKNIDFNIPGRSYRLPLKWSDVWRFGIGMEYDLLPWMCVRGGYTYDMDPSSKHHGSTMIPAGDRHIIGSGLGFEITENLWLDLGYSFIRMNNDDRFITLSNPQTGEKKQYKFATHNGFSHLVSATIRYSF
ncbi:MAG: outer membrane protein transport protein [Kiritimatiellae bacterium]|nr:outer membrane protein transport protein [Kiritimatiellia bacterium]